MLIKLDSNRIPDSPKALIAADNSDKTGFYKDPSSQRVLDLFTNIHGGTLRNFS